MTGLLILILFIAVIIIGVPIGSAIGFTTMISFLLLGGNIEVIPQKLFSGVNNFTFLCIPFFVLAAEIMADGGITRNILNFCNNLIGHIRGGLAHVNILASCFFAGITGSATADAVGLGTLEIKMMDEGGYPHDFSAGITAASAIIGPIIPPSNAMIIYATIAGNVSVVSLFLGGVLPGLLIGLSLMILCYFISKKNNYPVNPKRASIKMIVRSFIDTFPALMMPVIILGGILSGLFTATESAAIAVLYAILVNKFILKTFSWRKLYENILSTAKMTSVVFFIIAVASAMGWAITVLRVPQSLAAFFVQYASNKYAFLIFANILLLIVGMLLDQAPALLIMVPILLPVAASFSIHPIHFAMIVTINLCIGLISPPIGMTLFVTSSVAKISLMRMYRAILPFLFVEIVVLFIITFVPQISLFIPSLFGFV